MLNSHFGFEVEQNGAILFCIVFSRNRKKGNKPKSNPVCGLCSFFHFFIMHLFTMQSTLIGAGEAEVTDPSAQGLVEETHSMVSRVQSRA